MSGNVHIQLLGAFIINVDGSSFENLAVKSRKGVSLLEYLILQRGQAVSSQRLIRELWGGKRNENPESALKTMVSRLRALLNGVCEGLGGCIVSEQGAYRWESLPAVQVDALELMDLSDALRQELPAGEKTEKFCRVMTIYQGDLFQTGDMINGVMLLSWLHREYLDIVYAYIEWLKKAEEYNRVCEVCRAALLIDDLDEHLHIELMRAMVNLNRSAEAMLEYRRVARQSREELDEDLSKEMQNSYRQLAEEGRTLKFNLDVIRNELKEKEGERQGPFFCDYQAFKEIYNIQMRNLERLGSTIFLAVIMIGTVGDDETSAISREGAMAGMQEILRKNLRKGDIVTRFSRDIFAMLLPTVNYETSSMVMERVEHLFSVVYPSGNVTIQHRISPLGGLPDKK